MNYTMNPNSILHKPEPKNIKRDNIAVVCGRSYEDWFSVEVKEVKVVDEK